VNNQAARGRAAHPTIATLVTSAEESESATAIIARVTSTHLK